MKTLTLADIYDLEAFVKARIGAHALEPYVQNQYLKMASLVQEATERAAAGGVPLTWNPVPPALLGPYVVKPVPACLYHFRWEGKTQVDDNSGMLHLSTDTTSYQIPLAHFEHAWAINGVLDAERKHAIQFGRNSIFDRLEQMISEG